ncbi:alpha/beta hydrolase [Arthrobacter sp. H20]|uniref:RBBP9/YdeN family alpha/beta hydrolase n=1 Tax=Arthrobacter sp. H20 TaxID=1267981 RepID=UPI0004B50FB4|nr:alpha/beta hydrolase [Arthrobacter sp. H20]
MDIFVVHGYQASPGEHWFPWLKSRFSSRQDSVTVLELPTPNEPTTAGWIAALHESIGRPSAETVIIAHSLGCITALRYLASLDPGWSLGGLILVAGFAEHLDSLPLLDGFTTGNEFVDNLLVPRCTVIGSDNDPVVAPVLTASLASRLGARLITVTGGGHFGSSDGYQRFAEVQAELEKLLSQGR